MSDLNKVDNRVKASMLQYPSIFASRMDVLAHIFMVNGGGFYFDPESGEFTDGEVVEVPDNINRETRSSRIDTESSRVREAYENHVRDFVEANIDNLCKHNADYMTRDNVLMLSHTFYKERGVLSRVEKFLGEGNDPQEIDADWRQALKQFCTWFTMKCTRDGHVNDNGSGAKSSDKQLLGAYDMCTRLIKKLQSQDDKELLAKRSEIARNLIQRMKDKDNGK